MKKMISLTLSLSLLTLSLAGCGSASSSSASTASVSAPSVSATPSVSAASSNAAYKTATYVELSEDLGAEEYGVGFRSGDIALGLEVQKQLDAMAADGTAATISTKWFGADVLFKDKGFLEESKAPADDKSLETLKAKGTLIVGLDDSYPPMGFRDEKNELVGFDIDLAKEVAKRMGVKIEFQPIDWDAKELELTANKVDCLWNGMTITPERLKTMFFTKPYIANQQIIIVPVSSGITTKAQLEGKIIGLQKGSSSVDALNKDPISTKIKEKVEYPDNVSAFMDLQAGRVDAFVVDSVVGRYILAQDAK